MNIFPSKQHKRTDHERYLLTTFFYELRNRLVMPTLAVICVAMFGTIGYEILGHGRWGFLESLYMTSITLTTVGYGEILPNMDDTTRTFTLVLMWLGMLVTLFAISEVTAFVVEKNISKVLTERKMTKTIDAMRDHYIICGAGRTGIHILEELHTTRRPFVVIERDEERIEQLKEHFPGILLILGDATDEQVLEYAGIGHARGLVANVHDDSENLLITVQARYANPDIMIVARIEEDSLNAKVERAGADYVVNSSKIGGMRMASQILRPNTVTFLDRMLRGQDPSVRVDEAVVQEGAKICGKPLRDANIYQQCGLRIIAIQRGDAAYTYNPSGDEQLDPGTVLLAVGNPDQLQALRRLCGA